MRISNKWAHHYKQSFLLANYCIHYHKFPPKPKFIAELKQSLHVIWDNLPHRPIIDQQGC